MLHILMTHKIFFVVPRSFCENRNPHQDQDQDFTLDFHTRTILYT